MVLTDDPFRGVGPRLGLVLFTPSGEEGVKGSVSSIAVVGDPAGIDGGGVGVGFVPLDVEGADVVFVFVCVPVSASVSPAGSDTTGDGVGQLVGSAMETVPEHSKSPEVVGWPKETVGTTVESWPIAFQNPCDW